MTTDVVLHWGTTPRSLKGHLKVTARSNWQKTWFCGFFINSKPIWGAGEYNKWIWLSIYYWSGTISPRITRGLYAISTLGVITPLVFPLSHPFPKAGVNQQNYWCNSVEPQLEPPWQHTVLDRKLPWAGVVLYWGITSRSLQGQTKKIFIPNLFEMKVSITNDCCWHNIGQVPFHHARSL